MKLFTAHSVEDVAAMKAIAKDAEDKKVKLKDLQSFVFNALEGMSKEEDINEKKEI